MIEDDGATAYESLHVVDESDEDYAFSYDRFYPLDILKELELAIQVAA